MTKPLLTIDGDVHKPVQLTFADLAGLAEPYQVRDVSQLDPKRQGGAVRLVGLIELVEPRQSARYLTLHSSADDFHASIPLAAVLERAVLIYQQHGDPLPSSAGGPLRFFIPDFTACHTSEIDECANVKFVDRLELSADRGFDNRPLDEQEHAELHQREAK
jgi:hypothetical protein